MSVFKDGKVSRHTQTYKGAKLILPRIAITGAQLQECGFEIDDPIRITFDKDKQEIVIRRLEIETK